MSICWTTSTVLFKALSIFRWMRAILFFYLTFYAPISFFLSTFTSCLSAFTTSFKISNFLVYLSLLILLGRDSSGFKMSFSSLFFAFKWTEFALPLLYLFFFPSFSVIVSRSLFFDMAGFNWTDCCGFWIAGRVRLVQWKGDKECLGGSVIYALMTF